MRGEITIGRPLRIIDARGRRPEVLPKSSPRKTLKDPWALMLHQTAVDYGDASDEALIKRGERIPYHFLYFRRGLLVINRPLDCYSWHGNRANKFSIGLGIEGLYPGLIGGKVWGSKPETPWLPRHAVDLRECIRTICILVPTITHQIAHRQSSDKRRSDPGEAIWKSSEGILPTLPDWTVGDG